MPKKHQFPDLWQRGCRTVKAKNLGGWRSYGAINLSRVAMAAKQPGDAWRNEKLYAVRNIFSARVHLNASLNVLQIQGAEASYRADRAEFFMGGDRDFMDTANRARNSIRQNRQTIKSARMAEGFIPALRQKTIRAWTAQRRNPHVFDRAVSCSEMAGKGSLNILEIGNDAFIKSIEEQEVMREESGKAGYVFPFVEGVHVPIDFFSRYGGREKDGVSYAEMLDKFNMIPLAWNHLVTMGGIAVFKVAACVRVRNKKNTTTEWELSDSVSSDLNGYEKAVTVIGFHARSTHLNEPVTAFSLDMDNAAKLCRMRIVRKGKASW